MSACSETNCVPDTLEVTTTRGASFCLFDDGNVYYNAMPTAVYCRWDVARSWKPVRTVARGTVTPIPEVSLRCEQSGQ